MLPTTSSRVKVGSCRETTTLISTSIKPKYHSYTFHTIAMALDLAGCANLSNRIVEKVMKVVQRYVMGMFKVPSYNTIRIWRAKHALYKLCPKSFPQDLTHNWAIIADISISIGAQRLLVILGVDLDKYDHALPLSLSDVKVLAIGKKKLEGWTASAIVEFIEQRVLADYQVAYMISDAGPNIVRAAKDLKIIRVDDVSHSIARNLKSTYADLPGFERFISKCIHMRRYNAFNDFCGFRPPKVPSRARFMNISPLVKWAINMLALLDNRYVHKYRNKHLSSSHRLKLGWLQELRDLVVQLDHDFKTINNICRGLKAEGLSQSTVEWARRQLNTDGAKRRMNPAVRSHLHRYLSEQVVHLKVLELKTVICSTDIIESCFGYYKASTPKGVEIGWHSLQIATYGQIIEDGEQVRKMMEATRIKDLPQRYDRTVHVSKKEQVENLSLSG